MENKNGCLMIGMFFVALFVIISIIGFGMRWLNTGAEIVSPDNVKKQWEFAYTYEEQLRTAANQYCTAATAVANESGASKTQRQTQLIAREDNYNRIRAEYDAKLRNNFEAGLVAPSDVPRRAPTLEENVQKNCR